MLCRVIIHSGITTWWWHHFLNSKMLWKQLLTCPRCTLYVTNVGYFILVSLWTWCMLYISSNQNYSSQSQPHVVFIKSHPQKNFPDIDMFPYTCMKCRTAGQNASMPTFQIIHLFLPRPPDNSKSFSWRFRSLKACWLLVNTSEYTKEWG